MTSSTVGASPASASVLWGVSAVLLAIQGWTIARWSTAFSAAADQEGRVSYFLAQLPLGLGRVGVTNLTWLSAAAGTAGLIAAVVATRGLQGAGRALSIGLAAANALLVLWYLFTMM